jgi:hypothetical protein
VSDDSDLEELLRRYEPLAPPPELRDRVLDTSHAGPGWRRSLPWLTLAASLALSFALDRATARVERRLANFDTQALRAQALLESREVPELAVAGLLQPYTRRGPGPLWLGTPLPEGELP